MDHPRVCGEQLVGVLDFAVNQGSPPRVRGTATLASALAAAGRITPACAGNRRSSMISCHNSRITPACAGNRKISPCHAAP